MLDPSTASNYEDFMTKHFHLDLVPDFMRNEISGKCILTLQRMNPQAKTLLLDTSKLTILTVVLQESEGKNIPLNVKIILNLRVIFINIFFECSLR